MRPRRYFYLAYIDQENFKLHIYIEYHNCTVNDILYYTVRFENIIFYNQIYT